MLKILFYVSAFYAFVNLMILITFSVAVIMSGGGGVLFSGRGDVSLNFILLVLVFIEIAALAIALILYRKIRF